MNAENIKRTVFKLASVSHPHPIVIKKLAHIKHKETTSQIGQYSLLFMQQLCINVPLIPYPFNIMGMPSGGPQVKLL